MKNSSPMIILYTDDQISQLKFHANNFDDMIFGIDKTFNMGSLFVTAISYKDRRMVSKTTKARPVKIGPIFLHKESTENSFSFFLSEIKRNIILLAYSLL